MDIIFSHLNNNLKTTNEPNKPNKQNAITQCTPGPTTKTGGQQ